MGLIAVSGTQRIGKSTFIKDFLTKWPNYKLPAKSYRDVLKSKNLPNNRKTCKETQTAILDSMWEIIEPINRERDNIIMDRCPLDALVYTIWAYENGVGDFDEQYISNYIKCVRDMLRKFDVFFFIPITKHNIEYSEKELSDIDPKYRTEIDAFFKGLQNIKDKSPDNIYFPKNDCGPIIEIFGDREERIRMANLYIKDNGEFYGENDGYDLLDATGNSFLTKERIPLQYETPKIEDFK
jgi:thymidylate kinase